LFSSVHLDPKIGFDFVVLSLISVLPLAAFVSVNGMACVMLLFVIQEKDAKAREQRENERMKKIREIREAEKKASSAGTAANNAHWVCCC